MYPATPGAPAVLWLCFQLDHAVDQLNYGATSAHEFVDEHLENLRHELGSFGGGELAEALEGYLHDVIAKVVGDLLEIQTRIAPAGRR